MTDAEKELDEAEASCHGTLPHLRRLLADEWLAKAASEIWENTEGMKEDAMLALLKKYRGAACASS